MSNLIKIWYYYESYGIIFIKLNFKGYCNEKIICSMLLLGTITSTGIVPNATNNVDKASRGWSKSQGYYTDNIAI